jgi:FtsH-binding integral membrane protein
MNNANKQSTLPKWGKLVVVINLLVALWSLMGSFHFIALAIQFSFRVPDKYQALVAFAFVGAVLALLSAFGLTQAYKGRTAWTLAAIIMLAFFIVMSLFAFVGPDSVPLVIYIEFPVRVLSWAGLVALFVKQKKGPIILTEIQNEDIRR